MYHRTPKMKQSMYHRMPNMNQAITLWAVNLLMCCPSNVRSAIQLYNKGKYHFLNSLKYNVRFNSSLATKKSEQNNLIEILLLYKNNVKIFQGISHKPYQVICVD
ncbi:hypothetical protein CHS0354_004183 [Potamilus streckersoni]|uniref:Uncharacterized protein n=1 Tax=Potamilus streckersoni TaxID=2493646 RepID=A0AAE0T0G9_9BIVA|nr:hypothetical protein CHS0354_004183 [Potamilus streckersoni]